MHKVWEDYNHRTISAEMLDFKNISTSYYTGNVMTLVVIYFGCREGEMWNRRCICAFMGLTLVQLCVIHKYSTYNADQLKRAKK